MDRAASTKRDVLERMLLDQSVEPTDLPLSLMDYITNGFSDDKEIGRGGFAFVYKGMLRNGTVAVKKLFNIHLYENKFHQEVQCLMKIKHKNVVRFLGYCADTQGVMANFNGKLVMADVPQRLLCFEYLPKGTLHDYITDASPELGWTQYYQIIKGICAGLHYLHQNCIVHLDLKPSNILLDDSMVPKIADFGLSRCFDENQSHVITSKLFGSLGYLAPEFHCGRLTYKSDIYSLGVIIIEILTREKVFPEDYDVLERWGSRLEQLHRDTQLEQLRVCTEIGKECTNYDPRRRPDALTIFDRLDEADSPIATEMSNLSLDLTIFDTQDEADEEDSPIATDMNNLSLEQAEQDRGSCELIGSIGRELSLKCLLRLSRSDYGSVASLSRGLRSLVHSGDLYCLRRQQGVSEHWVYFSCNVQEWDAYDPYRERWIRLPDMPWDEIFMCSHKESLAVGTDLLVFGQGEGVEQTVFRYSILTNSWIRTDFMNYPRCLFASARDGEKAYLAGGADCYGRVLSTVEMYDSEKKEWAPLPNMNRARQRCSGLFMDGKLYVIGGKGSNSEVLTCGEEYDFKRETWRLIENIAEFSTANYIDGLADAPPLVAVVNNELYTADYRKKDVKKYDKQNNRWITLGNLPERCESMNGWGIGFHACGDRLIIIGGSRSLPGGMVQLYSWVPDGRPPVWNVIATRPNGNFVYTSAVMSC